MHSSWYTVSRFSFAMAMFVHRIYTPNPCTEFMHETTETDNAIMRWTKSLTPSPIVARSQQ